MNHFGPGVEGEFGRNYCHDPDDKSDHMLLVCGKGLSTVSEMILVCVSLLIAVSPYDTRDNQSKEDKQ